MITTTFSEALAAWRLAERRWEVARVDDPEFRALGIEVVSTWLRYHELMDREPGSFVLVADDDHAYVAVSDGVTAVLGYVPRDVIGRRIEDISPPDLAAGTPIAWGRFLADGRQDGRYRLIARDGRQVPVRFQARAHHPIPGFHTSRLWPDEPEP